nr:retrotransposon protein, putative, Ty1-copia subclass [Tanacetum cinerariifolium]
MKMWSGHPSDYEMLRIFSCVVYPNDKQGKLEPRAVKCVLLGYSKGVKGYRLYRLDDESPKMVTSRNVVFNESAMYKDTLKDSSAGNKSVEELQIEVELQREPMTRTKPLRFRDESNMAAYAFVAPEEEDTHKPLTYQEAVACEDNYELEQLDVKTAFLHGNLEEVIHMRQPLGYEQSNKVCLLKKSLYCLKQSPRQWYKRFDEYMLNNRFKRSSYDNCVEIGSTKSLLKKEFDMKELGEAKKILGMKIVRDRSRKILRVSQSGYVSMILNNFRINNRKPVKMPLGGHFKLSLKDCPVRDYDVERMSKVPYVNALGSLMYLMVYTRPDIAYAGCVVSWKATLQHVVALSTTKAEYMALTEAGVIRLSRNHVFHERTKHINVCYHFIKEVLEAKMVKVLKVGTEHKVADALMKVKVVEDVGEDEDFKSRSWVSATDYVNANGRTVSGCLVDIKNFLNNGKLDQVVAIVKFYSSNVIGDLTVTMKDLLGTIHGTIHHKVIGEGGYEKDILVGAALILANDPEDDDDEDPKEDPADYPADHDDDEEEEKEAFGDDADEEDEEQDEDNDDEEEEHPASADSILPPPVLRVTARISFRPYITPILPIPLPAASPSLQLLSSDRRKDRPEVTLPPRKRLSIVHCPGYEAGESSEVNRHELLGYIDTIMSDSEDSTVTYTTVSSPYKGRLGDVSPGVDGPLVIPEDPYAYVVAAFQALPPPNYVPGLEEPEQAPPSPVYIPYVPEPVYPEYIPPEDDVFPAEEQPLPAEDDDEDPEEDPADYLTDHDDKEEEEEPSGDDADEEDEEQDEDDDDKEEKHPASADSIPPPPALRVTARISFRPQPPTLSFTKEDAERFLAMPIPPPSPLTPLSSPLPQIPSPPLPALPLIFPIPLPAASPPLQLLSSDRRADRPEVTLPPRKRLSIVHCPRYEVGESSVAVAARPIVGRRADYGFVDSVEAEIRWQRT